MIKKDVSFQISYLVPCYNHENYIVDCLESIVADASSLDELIIIDDGSRDRSVEIIQNWIDRQVGNLPIQFCSRPNKGISATLNELIDAAGGEFIKLVSSDDKIIPGTTRHMKAYLQENPRILAVAGDVITIDENNRRISDSQMSLLGASAEVYLRDIKTAIICHWALCGPAVLFRQGFRETVGRYDESLVVEDWSMYLRLIAVDGFSYLNRRVGEYRVHSENTSMTKDTQRRIINLYSQKKAGEQAIPLFKGKYRYLLSGEVALIQTKIKYLEKRIIPAILSYLKYIYLNGWGRVIR